MSPTQTNPTASDVPGGEGLDAPDHKIRPDRARNSPFPESSPGPRLERPARRSGRGLVDVIVATGLVGFAMVLVMMALPRGREASRSAGCQRNLMQVGVGLQMYHQAHRHYPTVPLPGGPAGDGPVKAMLDAFVIPDFLDLHDPSTPPRPGQVPPRGVRVAGLACPSDPNAMAGPFPSSTSYRANAGDDPAGRGGPFEPGRVLTTDQVEAADGSSFTAAFAERLVGDGRDRHPAPWNYATASGAVGEGGCGDAPADRWRGDAGSDWAEASWRSALYAHTLPPGGSPSCIAADGRTARMGASSGHVNRVNVLLLDGSLRGVTTSIDPKVWRGLGTVGSPETKPMPEPESQTFAGLKD